MKHLKLSFVIIYVFIASSCGSTSDTSTQVNPHAAPHIEMHKELIKEENQKVMNRKILEEISGTYLGMLPCNDCEKIIYRLQLNEDETYQAKNPRSEESFPSTGDDALACLLFCPIPAT